MWTISALAFQACFAPPVSFLQLEDLSDRIESAMPARFTVNTLCPDVNECKAPAAVKAREL